MTSCRAAMVRLFQFFMKNPFKNIFGMNDHEIIETTDETLENKENMAENTSELPKSGDESARIKELESQVADLKDKFLRQAAEFDNFKKRSAREAWDLRQTAGREILAAIIPVIDDFDRAAQHAVFSEGVQLIYHKLQTIVQQRGLRVMDSNGADFDPDQHEAITEIPAPTEEMRGKVIDTVEKGYFLNDKIIRFAKVVVGK